MPPDVRTISHADLFRHSVPIRVASYYVLLFGCAVFSTLGVYPMPVGAIAAAVVFETLVLCACYRRALRSRRWAAAYLGIEALAQAAIFHLSGPVRISFAAPVYIFALLNPGMRLDRRRHFLVANGFVALFGAVVAAEYVGILPVAPRPELTISPSLTVTSVLIVLLCLNVAAFFIAAVRDQLEENAVALSFATQALRMHSDELEARVRERTIELEASYRAVERTSGELRAFIYNVTHDLKNPFNAILLMAELLHRREGDLLSADGQEDLLRIARTASRGEDMLRDLLGLFRVTSEPEPPRLVDLGAVVREAVEFLRPQFQDRRVEIAVGDVPAVWGQPTKLRHLVSNLLSNAVRFVPADRGAVDVSARSEDGHVVLQVRDNGIGIPAAYHRRIFELFGRVPEEEQGDGRAAAGTGVGLALVRRIVEDHGGAVWVDSAPGRGSCFFVRLPSPTTVT